MGARVSVPGIEDTIRVDVAGCVWIAYILFCVFIFQVLISVGLTIRWHYFSTGKMVDKPKSVKPSTDGDGVELNVTAFA